MEEISLDCFDHYQTFLDWKLSTMKMLHRATGSFMISVTSLGVTNMCFELRTKSDGQRDTERTFHGNHPNATAEHCFPNQISEATRAT